MGEKLEKELEREVGTLGAGLLDVLRLTWGAGLLDVLRLTWVAAQYNPISLR